MLGDREVLKKRERDRLLQRTQRKGAPTHEGVQNLRNARKQGRDQKEENARGSGIIREGKVHKEG